MDLRGPRRCRPQRLRPRVGKRRLAATGTAQARVAAARRHHPDSPETQDLAAQFKADRLAEHKRRRLMSWEKHTRPWGGQPILAVAAGLDLLAVAVQDRATGCGASCSLRGPLSELDKSDRVRAVYRRPGRCAAATQRRQHGAVATLNAYRSCQGVGLRGAASREDDGRRRNSDQSEEVANIEIPHRRTVVWGRATSRDALKERGVHLPGNRVSATDTVIVDMAVRAWLIALADDDAEEFPYPPARAVGAGPCAATPTTSWPVPDVSRAPRRPELLEDPTEFCAGYSRHRYLMPVTITSRTGGPNVLVVAANPSCPDDGATKFEQRVAAMAQALPNLITRRTGGVPDLARLDEALVGPRRHDVVEGALARADIIVLAHGRPPSGPRSKQAHLREREWLYARVSQLQRDAEVGGLGSHCLAFGRRVSTLHAPLSSTTIASNCLAPARPCVMDAETFTTLLLPSTGSTPLSTTKSVRAVPLLLLCSTNACSWSCDVFRRALLLTSAYMPLASPARSAFRYVDKAFLAALSSILIPEKHPLSRAKPATAITRVVLPWALSPSRTT